MKKEVSEAKCSEHLVVYLKSKELELISSKQNIRMNHISKINAFYHVDSENLRKAFIVSCELNQSSYLLLRSHEAIDTKHKEKLEKLSKMINGHGIRFKQDVIDSDEDIDFQFDNDIEQQINGKRSLVDDETSISWRNHCKKLHFSDDTDLGIEMLENIDADMFKQPHALQVPTIEVNDKDVLQGPSNANETIVISANDECNRTFNAPTTSTYIKSIKSDLISHILSEHNTLGKNKIAIKNGKSEDILINISITVLSQNI